MGNSSIKTKTKTLYDDTKDMQHTGRNVWLSEEETRNFLHRCAKANEDITWYLQINPLTQTLSLIATQNNICYYYTFCCCICNCQSHKVVNSDCSNIPYIGYEWIPQTIMIKYEDMPYGIRIPRGDLRSCATIDTLAIRHRETKLMLKDGLGENVSTLVNNYMGK